MKKRFLTNDVVMLGRCEVEELLSMGETLKGVENAFRLDTEGRATKN